MSDGGDGASELEDLKAQNEALQEEVERIKGVKHRRMRAVVAVIALVVAVVTFATALPGAWARRTLTDQETYIAVVGPLAADPAVQEALAREITAAVFEAIDVQGKLTDVLTEKAPQLTFLAGPITQSVQQFTQDQVEKILASEQFQTFWVEANRVLQRDLVAVLRGDSEVLQVQNGEVVLNYLPLVNQALQAVSGTLSSLLNRPDITLPEITADTVPTEAVDKLNAALGTTLPATFGSLVVYRSDVLSTVQDSVELAREALFALVFLLVVAVAVALAVSPHRRRTLLQLAVAIAVVTVIERRIGISSVDNIVGLAKPENQAAVKAIADALIGWFLDYTVRFLWIAVITIVIALLTGPYRWAVWFRGAVDDVVHHTMQSNEEAPEGSPSAWIAGHRGAVMGGVALLAALVYWAVDLSGGWLLLWLLVTVVLELVGWRVARGPEVEAEATG